MEKQIILLDDKPYKCMSFDDEQLLFSSKVYKNFDDLVQANIKSGFMESTEKIEFSNISKVDYNESDDNFSIHYTNEKGKNKSMTIVLDSPTTRGGIVGALSASVGLKELSNAESTTMPLLWNIGFIVLAIAMTWVFYGRAVDAEAGIVYEATGRRSGIKNLMSYFVELIGKWGVLGLGSAALAYLGYRTYNRYNNPSSIISFERA